MVVGGAPDRCSRAEAARKVASFALAAQDCVKNFRTPNGSTINIRAGIGSGAVVAGVVGNVMPRCERERMIHVHYFHLIYSALFVLVR